MQYTCHESGLFIDINKKNIQHYEETDYHVVGWGCRTPPVLGQTKLDTLFYDKDWKCITTRPFASYYRVMERTTDTTHAKPYRGYYYSGALQAEGKYISFDKDDDTKSVYDGDYEMYFKSGNTAEKGSWANGKREGEFTTYNEDGLIVKHLYYSDGELDGVCTEFNEDGSTCVQTEYTHGQPKYDYFVMSNKDGLCSKVSLSDGKPIYGTPERSDMTVSYIEDLPWAVYNKDGISVGMCLSDWGMRLSLYITNNSMFPINIDADKISVTFRNEKDNFKQISVYSYADYSRKVQRSAAWDKFFNAVGENIAASQAGKSVSTTTSAYAGTTGSGRIVTGGSASTTTTYDATAAYQARITASDRIATYNNALDAQIKVVEAGYMKSTVINPGETVIGYLIAKPNNGWRVRAGLFDVNIDVSGVTYSSIWNLIYVKRRIHLNPVVE